MPNEPQPTPSPTPVPVRAVQIGDILPILGGATLFPSDGSDSFDVTTEYLEVCEPVAGGYYVTYGDDQCTFVPEKDFTDKFPQ